VTSRRSSKVLYSSGLAGHNDGSGTCCAMGSMPLCLLPAELDLAPERHERTREGEQNMARGRPIATFVHGAAHSRMVPPLGRPFEALLDGRLTARTVKAKRRTPTPQANPRQPVPHDILENVGWAMTGSTTSCPAGAAARGPNSLLPATGPSPRRPPRGAPPSCWKARPPPPT
jgi:hypothetical protein